MQSKRFDSLEEASSGLREGARFANVRCATAYQCLKGDSKVIKTLCTTSKQKLLAAMRKSVSMAAQDQAFHPMMEDFDDILRHLYRLFLHLSRSFTFDPASLSIRLIAPNFGAINVLGARTFHTDRIEDFFLLHTLTAEGGEASGTEVADMEGDAFQELLRLDDEFRLLREKQSKEGTKELNRDLIALRTEMDSLVPQEAVVKTETKDTLILRGDPFFPTFHRSPNYRFKRVLIGMPGLKLR